MVPRQNPDPWDMDIKSSISLFSTIMNKSDGESIGTNDILDNRIRVLEDRVLVLDKKILGVRGDDLPTRVTKIRGDLTAAQNSVNYLRTELGQIKVTLQNFNLDNNKVQNNENDVDVSDETVVKIIESTYQFTPLKMHGGGIGIQPGAFKWLPKADQLSFNVVHLETMTRRTMKGQQQTIREVSTGFLVNCNEIEATEKIVLVTTKHSIEVTDLKNQHCVVKFHFFDKMSRGKCVLAEVQFPSTGYKVGNQGRIGWISPTNKNNDHDYIVLPISPLLKYVENQIALQYQSTGFYPLRHVLRLKGDLLPEVDGMPLFQNDIGYFSNVVMLGYPLMLSNSSFLPIARFGQCASNPHSSNRRDEHPTVRGDFLVDMSCCAGSSGSPVWFISRTFDGEVFRKDITTEYGSLILEDGEVEVSEDTQYVFAGMMFESPDGSVKSHDVHLGCINSAHTLGDFLASLVQQERF